MKAEMARWSPWAARREAFRARFRAHREHVRWMLLLFKLEGSDFGTIDYGLGPDRAVITTWRVRGGRLWLVGQEDT